MAGALAQARRRGGYGGFSGHQRKLPPDLFLDSFAVCLAKPAQTPACHARDALLLKSELSTGVIERVLNIRHVRHERAGLRSASSHHCQRNRTEEDILERSGSWGLREIPSGRKLWAALSGYCILSRERRNHCTGERLPSGGCNGAERSA